MRRGLTLVGLCVLALHSSVRSQGDVAVPFLLLPVSARSNGMGGAGTALTLDDPLAITNNPAQLGSFSLHGTVALAFTPAGAQPKYFGYQQSDGGHTGYGVMGGYRLDTLLGLPFAMSAGFGYTHNLLDLGKFTRTSSGGPTVIGTFEAWERSNALSLGIGLEYGLRLGIGGAVKWITSNLSPIGTEQEEGSGRAEVTAYDLGFLLEAPVGDFVLSLATPGERAIGIIRPVLDLSVSYALCNIGDEVVYIDPDQADPLPRNVTTAIGIVAGAKAMIDSLPWNLGTFRWTRQGEDLLVSRYTDGGFAYRSGLGDIRFVDDVVLGKTNAQITQKTGWELELGELVAFRGGKYRPVLGTGSFTTSGFGIRLAGILKGIRLLKGPEEPEDWVSFCADHIGVQYDTGTYSGSETTYSQLTVVLRGFPW